MKRKKLTKRKQFEKWFAKKHGYVPKLNDQGMDGMASQRPREAN